MIEYGLSVSLDGTPRTPHCCDYGPSPVNNAPRKYMSFGDFVGGGDGGVSVSPRVLFSDVAVVATARRLDFDNTELTPVSFASASVASASAAASVGDCGVCYNALPARSNHVFTLCGHLFCVRCVLKWWDTNSTCPICRAELFESSASVDDDDDDVAVEGVSVAGGGGGGAADADADADSDDSDDNRLIRYIYGDTNNNNNHNNNNGTSDDSDSDDSDISDRDDGDDI